jgi:hypothetical protein
LLATRRYGQFTQCHFNPTRWSLHVGIDSNSALGVTDGFALVLQSVGSTALGVAGQGMVYEGIAPSVAVIFRGRATGVIGVVTGGLDFNDVKFAPPSEAYLPAEGVFSMAASNMHGLITRRAT